MGSRQLTVAAAIELQSAARHEEGARPWSCIGTFFMRACWAF
jgi:hypothetical protein